MLPLNYENSFSFTIKTLKLFNNKQFESPNFEKLQRNTVFDIYYVKTNTKIRQFDNSTIKQTQKYEIKMQIH